MSGFLSAVAPTSVPAFLHALQFLRPHWLWALLALPLLWAAWRVRERRRSVWRGVVDPHLLPHLLEQRGRRLKSGFWLFALGYALAVLALAGPSARQASQPLWQSQAPLVLALDLSDRISANDLPPSRLLQARAKLATLLRERAGGQVALLAYAGDAFTVAPLTDDAANVALFLDALEPQVMPVQGQRGDRAIAAATALLRQAGFERGDILLLTDGADAETQRAAADARRQGYRVSALGLGTAAGAAYREADGRIGRARLDAASLQVLAAAGGGRYRVVSRDDADLRALGVLDPQQAQGQAGGAGGRVWLDQGYWLLPPLMLLALLAFRRGSAVAVLLLCLWLPMATPAQAAGVDWWRRADQKAHARIEQGAQAYRRGDFQAAEQAFQDLDSADAQYNHGNALAKQGRYDEAIAAYDAALKRQPGMADAIANRAAVEAARKRQPPQQGNSQSSGAGQGQQQKQDPQGQHQQAQGQNQPSQGQQSQNRPNQSRSNQNRQAQQDAQHPPRQAEPNPPPQDAQSAQQAQTPEQARAQQAADAAQRQRMQQAVAQGRSQDRSQDADGKPLAAAREETPEQRERRQATEAWLRRVPDDPGGLLQAKFRLEYERRQREGQ